MRNGVRSIEPSEHQIISKFGVYQIINKVNKKRYIGSSVYIKKRLNSHMIKLVKGAHHSVKLQRAFNKYGEDRFLFSVIEYVIEKKNIIEREQFWIDKYNSCKNGYNSRPVAQNSLGFKHSKETKKKMSISGKNKIFTDEHKKRLSEAAKNMTAETKLKISKARKGQKLLKSTIKKQIKTRRLIDSDFGNKKKKILHLFKLYKKNNKLLWGYKSLIAKNVGVIPQYVIKVINRYEKDIKV